MDKTINIALNEQRPEYVLSLKDVENGNLLMKLQFEESLLSQLCETYQLQQFNKLEAKIEAMPWRADGIKIHGEVSAEFVQTSIVSLKPIKKKQRFEITRTFEPVADRRLTPESEIEIDPLEDDPPDNLVEGKLNLAELILEAFTLELDLYPRIEGEVLGDHYQSNEAEIEKSNKTNPFSVLKGFKTNDNS